MKPVALVSACLATVFALAGAAAAQAIPFWEVKGPPGPALYHLLPEGEQEVVFGTVAMSITGGKGTLTEYKDVCSGTSVEAIENPLGGAEGIDFMLEFTVNCPANGLGPFPCGAEPYSISQIGGEWQSELFGLKGDLFEGVEVAVRCSISGGESHFHPPGHLWAGRHGANVQTFPYQPAIPFKKNPYFFNMWGTIKLKPAVYVDVR